MNPARCSLPAWCWGLRAVLEWQWRQQRGWPMLGMAGLAGCAVASAAADAAWLAADALSGSLWFAAPWLSWMLLALLLQGWLVAYRAPRLDRKAGCTLLFTAPVPVWLVQMGRFAGGLVPLAALALVIEVADGAAAHAVGLQPDLGRSLGWLAWGVIVILAPALALLVACGAWVMAQGARPMVRRVALLVLLVGGVAMIRLVLSWIMAEPGLDAAAGGMADLAWCLRRWPGMVPQTGGHVGVPAFPDLPPWAVACGLGATCLLLGMAWRGACQAEFPANPGKGAVQEEQGGVIVRRWQPQARGRWDTPALVLLGLQGRLWRHGAMAAGLFLAPVAVMAALVLGWPEQAPDEAMAGGLLVAVAGMVASALWTSGSRWPIAGLPGLPPQGFFWWFSWDMVFTLIHGACAWAGFCLGVWWTLQGIGMSSQMSGCLALFGYGWVVAAWPLGGLVVCGVAMLDHAPQRLRLPAGLLLAATGALLVGACWQFSYEMAPAWAVALGRLDAFELRLVWGGLPQEPFWIMLTAGLLAWPGRCWLLGRRS